MLQVVGEKRQHANEEKIHGPKKSPQQQQHCPTTFYYIKNRHDAARSTALLTQAGSGASRSRDHRLVAPRGSGSNLATPTCC